MRYRNNDKLRPDVSIRIINWNTHELLEQCLTSVIQNTKDVSFEIVIIDNNSTGTGFKKVKEKFSGYTNITWIENDKNRGGLVDDQTLPYCHGRYLLILGPDAVVLPQSLKKMVEFLDNNEEAGAVTAKLLNLDGSPQNYYYKFWNLRMFFFSTILGGALDKIFFKDRFKLHYFGGDVDPSKITIVEQPAGACLMLRWDPPVVDYITHEDFPFYFGDVDLCKRIYANGYKIFLLPSAEVIHFKGSSFKKADSDWKRKEYKSSAIKYFKKYHKNKLIFLKLILFSDDAVKYIYKKLFLSWIEHLKRELSDCNTVLDLGCGYNSSIQHCKVPFSVGVELFEPYLQESKKKGIHNQYIKADIRKVEFKPKSFDAILCSDVLEHLTKEEGYELIIKMEKWSRKKIIIITPNGYLWQDDYDSNPLQEHKSGWSVEELERLGLNVFGMNGWKKLRGYRGSVKYKPTLLWSIIANLTQKISYRYPKFAFQLFAVKQTSDKK